MKRTHLAIGTLLLTVAASAAAAAQTTRVRNNDTRRPGTTIPSRGGAPRPTTGLPGTSRGPVLSPGRDTGNRGGIFDRSPRIPVRPYCPRPTEIYPGARYLTGVSFRNWERGFWFLNDLGYRYSSFNARPALWRMATGASGLTPESLRLSTAGSRRAAGDLLSLTDEIDGLIDDYEAGRLDAKQFRKAVEERTDDIRDHAREIRKDDLIDYVDVRKDQKIAGAERATSLAALRDLTARLRGLALDLQGSLEEYAEGDLAQVVSLHHLERPSVDSLSKGIDSLAKTIEKSADRL